MIELARLRGYKVEEAPVSVEEAMTSDEVFTTGTAVVLCAVGSLTYKVRSALPSECVPQSIFDDQEANVGCLEQGQKKQFSPTGKPSKVALELYTALTDIQLGRAEDSQGWVHTVA